MSVDEGAVYAPPDVNGVHEAHYPFVQSIRWQAVTHRFVIAEEGGQVEIGRDARHASIGIGPAPVGYRTAGKQQVCRSGVERARS
jgi:hypothetical protein